MADSRQTKIVSYQLQGDTSNLMNELKAAATSLDALDRKLTHISSEARMVGGKDRTTLARAAVISSAETQLTRLKDALSQANIKVVSPDQLNYLKQMNVELAATIGKLESYKSEQTITQQALSKTRNTLRSMNKSLQESNVLVTESTSKWANMVKGVSKAAVAFTSIRRAVSTALRLYEAAADLAETMNLFNVATQESSEKLYDVADAMSKAYGADIQPVLKSLAVFRQYANTMGFAADQANILSEYLTKVTYDLASLYNVANEDMARAIKSGLTGQTKPLMQYGISVHKATLEQYALNMGIHKTWQEFTEADKVALRYIAILDQASSAQGDFAKTLESPANQLRIAQDQVKIFVRSLGTLVSLLGQYVLPLFNAGIRAVNRFIEALSKAAGYEIEDYSDSLSATNQMLDDGTESAEEYADAVSSALAPLDEINQATSGAGDTTTTAGIDPALLDALQGYDNLMDQISDKTTALSEAFSNLIPPELAEGVGDVLGVGFQTFEQALEVVSQLLATLSPVLKVVLTVLGAILEVASFLIENIISPALSFISLLTDNIWLLVDAFTALNLLQLAVTGDMKSLMAVKIVKWFINFTSAVWKNVDALLAQIAASIKARAASIREAIANWWSAKVAWQKAVAIIATAGALALVVSATVLAATTAANARADSSLGNSPNIPAMATGGVIDTPTVALVGEGRYSEAVVPLGRSPQFAAMKSSIAEEVARKIAQPQYGSTYSRGSQANVILQVNGRELARALLPDLGITRPQTGVKLT